VKGQELTKEEKVRLRKEKKLQKKSKEKVSAPVVALVVVEQESAPQRVDSFQPSVAAPVAPPHVSVTYEPPAGGKTKAELRAERRAKQEAERASKQSKKAQASAGQASAKVKAPPPEGQTVKRLPEHVLVDDPEAQKKLAKKLERQQ
ncbi:hypothetical protein GDO81_019486, partial [Engystomops pustulosus]